MNISKALSATLYYHATYQIRQWKRRSASAAGHAPIGVMTFHRIADDQANPWTTSTSTFMRAIRWLKNYCELISLEEAQQRVRANANHRLSMCVTFDDGYSENCRDALPFLMEEKIPCTYFVCTQPVLEGSPFGHDLNNGQRFSPNTVEELKSLAESGIEIGAHTRTHADLGKTTDPETLYDEVVTARDELQDAIGRRIRYFAFPFGMHTNLSPQAFQVAREAGYDAVFSAFGGYNFAGGDPFHLKRRCIDGSLLRVKNWVTIDPFRNRHVPDFNYSTSASHGRTQAESMPAFSS